MGDSKIEWTDKTWNPLRARNILTGDVGWFCEHVSAGCGLPDAGGCYAEKMNENTYFGNGLPYKASSLPKLELFLDEEILQQPLRWRAPKKVFVCSMTDLFGRFVKDKWIDKVFAVMALCPRHTFQVLTKRPERMRDYATARFLNNQTHLSDAACWASETANDLAYAVTKKIDQESNDVVYERLWGALHQDGYFPNIWLGTSCEDQETADKRIPDLLATPAHRRFVSYEPALGPLNLLNADGDGVRGGLRGGLHQLIIGGESGPRARPFDVAWARKAISDCRLGGIAPFVKQLGAKPVAPHNSCPIDCQCGLHHGFKHKKGGDIEEFPADLQIREYPT